MWMVVKGSSSGTERTSSVRKCEGVSVDIHSMPESLMYESGLEFSYPLICDSKVVNSSKVNMVSPNTIFRENLTNRKPDYHQNVEMMVELSGIEKKQQHLLLTNAPRNICMQSRSEPLLNAVSDLQNICDLIL
ncbi:hypothetical protein TNCV_206451 [Trichonephila clavipes]|nr:hypothetical protein TNCV_206451 [Trichonephila clavipes]